MSRICLVGAGYISRVHLDALRMLPGHQVVADRAIRVHALH